MTKPVRATLITVSVVLMSYVVVGGVLGSSETSSEKTYRDLGVYSEVLNRINQEYVTSPDLKKVTDGAIRGLLESLDPYSTYLTPDEYKEYLQHPVPGPADIGLFISKRMGYATVVAILPGSPAEKAGVKPGDLIDQVDGTPSRQLSVVQLEREMAGPSDSVVKLTLVREGRTDPVIISVTRGPLNYPPVFTKMVDEGTGYLRVATFNKGIAQELAGKIKQLESQGAHKLVLDLRDCAGGEIQEAVDTASLFLEKGLVTYISGQRFPRQDVDVHPTGQVCGLPLALLINQSTAGPAELVASAMLRNKRGDVVGVRSFGEGVYQKPIPVGDGSALLLAVAKYYGADGKPISENGVTPSVVQPASTADAESADEESPTEEPEHFGGKDDLQLRKAIEVLGQPATVAKAA
jgi:carboxyl-terminal processing protease